MVLKKKWEMAIGLLFVATSVSANPGDWSDLAGCYTTVSFNGQPGSPKAEDRGWTHSSESFDFATMPGVDHIRSFELVLFGHRQTDTSYFGWVWIFPDYGSTQISADGKTRTYSFKGPMICTGLCSSPQEFTFESRVEVSDLGNNLYRLHNYRRVPELADRSMDADDTYVLKRVDCESVR